MHGMFNLGLRDSREKSGSMRPKARVLAQHGGPPGWLEESDPAGSDFVSEWKAHAGCPDGPHHLPRSGADLLLNVHKTPS
jgi:hypothetical protein